MSITVGGYSHHHHHHQSHASGPTNFPYQAENYPTHFTQSRFDPPPSENGRYFSSWMLNPAAIAHMGYDSSMPLSVSPMDCSGPPTGTGYPYGTASTDYCSVRHYDIFGNIGQFRGVKRRVTANKKERRRTESINSAFAQLRGCIPNVPSDTKLSKIKTLRLATSYISYLMELLSRDDPVLENSFKADIHRKNDKRDRTHPEPTANTGEEEDNSSQTQKTHQQTDSSESGSDTEPRGKGRTGWPQAVWASELK